MTQYIYILWGGCDIGTNIYLPINHYAKARKDKFIGNFKTEVRFSVSIKDTVLFTEPTIIYSKPLTMMIPEDIFRTKYSSLILQYDDYINSISDLKRKAEFSYRKALQGYKFDDLHFVKEGLLQALSFDSNNGKIRNSLGQLYMRYWSDNRENLTINEQAILICASINEMEKIDLLEFPDKRKYVIKYLKMGKDYFSKKDNWNQEETQDCKIINGKYKCYEQHFIKDYVEIKFKSEK